MNNPTERFSDRVANYASYRPSYPPGLIDILASECNLGNQSTIADIGSGTGIFSRLLLDKGFQVAAVEPNENMRREAELQLMDYKNFTSVAGESESTGLAKSSIDLITAAQAFHWFRRDETKPEFFRILKPAGQVALIWNQRKIEQPFQKEYDDILRKFSTDYNTVNHMNISYEDIAHFFSPHKVVVFEFENSQIFDLTGLLGRIQSSSYTPKTNTREYVQLMQVAESMFNRYERGGVVKFEYTTRLYLAQIFS